MSSENREREALLHLQKAFRRAVRGSINPDAAPLQRLQGRIYDEKDNSRTDLSPSLATAKKLFDELTKLAMKAKQRKNQGQFSRVITLLNKLADCLEKQKSGDLKLEDIVDLADFTLQADKTAKRNFLSSVLPSSIGESRRKENQLERLHKTKGRVIPSKNALNNDLSNSRKNRATLSPEKSMFVVKSANEEPAKAALAEVIKDLKSSLKLNPHERKTQQEIIQDNGGVTDVVISGGGAKYRSQIGVLKILEEKGLLGSVAATYGSSVGSISATTMAFGCSVSEIEAQMNNVPLKTIGDKLTERILSGFKKAASTTTTQNSVSSWLRSKILRINLKGGEKLHEHCKEMVHKNFLALFSGQNKDEIEKKINALAPESLKEHCHSLYEKYLTPHVGFISVSFADLKALQSLFPEKIKDLYITGTNLKTKQLEYYSAEDTPEMDIALAMRISCSLPGAFSPVNNMKGEPCVDGGLTNNFPCDRALENQAKRKPVKENGKPGVVLGVNLDNNKHYYVPESFSAVKRIFRDFFSAIAAGCDRTAAREKRERIMAKGNAEGRLCVINAAYADVSSSAFDLSEQEMSLLEENGKNCARNFLDKKVWIKENKTAISTLYDHLLTSGLNKDSFALVKYKTPYYQQNFMEQVKLELEGLKTDEDKIAYLKEVKNSPIYEIIKGNPYQSQGGLFKDISPKKEFDFLLQKLEHQNRSHQQPGRAYGA